MDVRFVGQPFEHGGNLYDVLTEILTDTHLSHVTMVTAWAKRSGLYRVEPELRGTAASTRILVGIDEGGATRQGLVLAVELFDEAYVVHDRSSRTFHPKLYLGVGDDRALVFVGSNNVTAGGVFFNYEAGLRIELDLGNVADRSLLQTLEEWIGRLVQDEAICLPLDEGMIETLLRTPGVRISDEDVVRPQSSGGPSPPGDDGDAVGGPVSPFGSSPQRRRSDPRPYRGTGSGTFTPSAQSQTPPATSASPGGGAAADSPSPTASSASPPHLGATTPGSAGMSATSPPTVLKRWTKVMALSDAQHPATGNPTGVIRLNQARHPINWRTWFRNELFGTATWVSDMDVNANPIEKTDVPFDVVIDGVQHGTHVMTVDHAPHREANQGNVTTILHLGPVVGHLLRQTNYVNRVLTIERLRDGAYRFVINQVSPQPAAIP